MFAEHIEKSNIVELVEDELDEEGQVYRATLRVAKGRTKRWIRMVTSLLQEASEAEEFDLEPHKSYYWDKEGKAVKYVWVLLIWGDLEAAKESIGDLLETRHEPPAPKAADPRNQPTSPALRHKLRRIKDYLPDGSPRVRTRTTLPHIKEGSQRYQQDPDTIIRHGNADDQRMFKATARGRGVSENTPAIVRKEL